MTCVALWDGTLYGPPFWSLASGLLAAMHQSLCGLEHARGLLLTRYSVLRSILLSSMAAHCVPMSLSSDKASCKRTAEIRET